MDPNTIIDHRIECRNFCFHSVSSKVSTNRPIKYVLLAAAKHQNTMTDFETPWNHRKRKQLVDKFEIQNTSWTIVSRRRITIYRIRCDHPTVKRCMCATACDTSNIWYARSSIICLYTFAERSCEMTTQISYADIFVVAFEMNLF